MSEDPRPVVEVVAAVVLRPDGSFLLAQRPPGKVYAGYWEFPGGKIEPGETGREALGRELAEELGIRVRGADPWICREYSYPHARVRLHFWRVRTFDGEPQPHEDQRLSWERSGRIRVDPLLPANGPILAALALPEAYAISNAGELGPERFLEELDAALRAGLRLMQMREPGMPASEFRALAAEAVARVRRADGRVLINSDAELARGCGADGVHLKASQLAVSASRPDLPLVGASCHDARDLAHAVRLGVDFAVLGPVMPTLSHPGSATLGWDGFARIASDSPIPVYALGGLGFGDRVRAWAAGGHGVAMQRAAWSRFPHQRLG